MLTPLDFSFVNVDGAAAVAGAAAAGGFSRADAGAAALVLVRPAACGDLACGFLWKERTLFMPFIARRATAPGAANALRRWDGKSCEV